MCGAADNTISYRLTITGKNCLDWKPGLDYYYWYKQLKRRLQSTETNDQKKDGRQVISSQITKDTASTRSALEFVPFSRRVAGEGLCRAGPNFWAN